MDQALALIAEAKRTRATTLDLGNCGLTELPGALFELTWLEELILSSGWNEFDLEKQRWEPQKSPNEGKPNYIASIAGVEALVGLKKLVVAGEWNKKWILSDLNPLKNLVQLRMIYCYRFLSKGHK